MEVKNDFLYHFGVLGMKWGVRRYQEYPKGKHGSFLGQTRDDDIRIKKNTSAYRVQSSGELNGQGQSFISLDKLDTIKYLEAAANGDMGVSVDATIGDKQIFNVTLKLSNDLILPSYQKTMDAFVNTVESIGVKDVAKEFTNIKAAKNFVNNYKKQKIDSLRDESYVIFVSSFMKDTKAKRRFFKELSDQGYNAIIDEFDVRFGKNYTKTPVIVFDKTKTIKKIDATKLTKKDLEFFKYLSWNDSDVEEYGISKKYQQQASKWEQYAGKKVWK